MFVTVINFFYLVYESWNIWKEQTIFNIEQLEDAYYSGSLQSKECTLIVTEGKSAKSSVVSFLFHISITIKYLDVWFIWTKLQLNFVDL